jgi:hypothetical protein
MLIFKRKIEDKIRENLFKGKILIMLGPRQAGKTTLSKKILNEFGKEAQYFNCELLGVRGNFVLGKPKLLHDMVGDKKIVVFDEAQTIENIGSILKTYIDSYKNKQIIATGSSSFDLSNKINEPLTGRAFEYYLYPLSLEEMSLSKVDYNIEEILRFGCYPEIVAQNTGKEREEILKNIATNYLYKDVFIFESIKNPTVFENLLKLLALQIGSLVSVNELSQTLGVSRTTIDKYLKLLEQSFVIKRVYSFSRNYRTEIKKSFKIYFLDVGIRNAIISDVSSVERRKDKGALLENFVFTELFKHYTNDTFPPRIQFWRTRTGNEVDFILEKGQEITAIEVKWKKENFSFKNFLKKYPESKTKVVSLNEIHTIFS